MADLIAKNLDSVFVAKDEDDFRQDERSAIQLLIKQKIGLISRQWTARAARLFKSSGHTNAQRAPLYLLRNAPAGLTQAELANGLDLSEPTLSRRITRLLEDGLVSKNRLVGDGRANLIKLEPLGHLALENSEAKAARDRNLLFHGLTDEDLGVTLRVLEVLASRIVGPVDLATEGDGELAAY